MKHLTDRESRQSRRSPLALLVEADQGHRLLIEKAFSRSDDLLKLKTVLTLREAREYLADQRPDVLIVDPDLPDGDGRELLPEDIEQSPFPIIVLTAPSDEKAAVPSFVAGASDCVAKSAAALEAMPRIASRVLHGWHQVERRRLAESALLHERQRLAGIVKALPPIVVGMQADGTINMVNPAGEQVCGHSSGELVGRNWCHTFFAERDRLCAEQMIQDLKRSGQPVVRETALKCCGGGQRFISWELIGLRERSGAAGELIALGTDIASLRQTEAMNRIQSSALQAVANCVVITDRNGCVNWVNPSFTRITGYSLEEVVGKNLRILKSGKHNSEFYRDLWESILAGRVWEGVLVNRRKDGVLYDDETTITPVPDESGQITHFIAIKQDITERRKAERAMKNYAKTLEETARELAEITWIAEQTRDEAERANKVKSEFLAKMSHELRTPLNSIIGFTELMIDDRQDVPGAKRANRLEKVHRNAKNLLALINDILDLSKIEADRLSLDWAWLDVQRLIRECVESAQPLVRPDVRLEAAIDPSVTDTAQWYGDEVRLRQSLTNLLSNAAKFTESGRIEVRAAIDEGVLVIDVEDTGIGIAPENLSRVFREFEQVDSSSTRRAGGTGLGLAITQRLCKLMKGEISVKSQLGTGSCFTIRLPRLSESDISEAAGTDSPASAVLSVQS